MSCAKTLSRSQQKKIIKVIVDEHMEEISRKAEVSMSLEPVVSQLPPSPIRKKIKLSEALQNPVAPVESEISFSFLSSSDSDNNSQSVIDSDISSSETRSITLDCNPLANDKNLQGQLGACFLKHNASHALINDILSILKPFHSLPSDARTLLKTPQHLPSKQLGNGEFVYFGLKEGIKEKMKAGLTIHTGKLSLLFNIDGLPLHKSSNKQFWPILCQIEETVDRSPFPVAIFCGSSKPASLSDFLSDFIDELSNLKDGIEGINQNIIVKGFVCDAPARAFIKCVKPHNAYNGCEKCCQEGDWENKRVTFPDVNAPKRKDSDFLNFSFGSASKHIVDKSPLLNLGLGLVTQFPLDYMHLVCLGVMRKLLISWCRGPLTVRLCSRDVDILSDRLTSFAKYVPDELPRKPRSLREIDRWKATEFRMFLLYLGPVVLKKILPSRFYNHFLFLHVAIRILCSKVTLRENLPLARELLSQFVSKSKRLYGPEFIIYNVHNLIHLPDDAEKFGPLDSFSSFPFENYLGQLKRLLRSPNKPLQQICRRVVEIRQNSTEINEPMPDFQVVWSSIHKEGPTASLEGQQFKAARKDDFIIKCKENNRCVMLKNGKIISVSNIIIHKDIIKIIGRRFKSKSDFYSKPCSSSVLNTFFVSNLSISARVYSISDVKEKGILLPYCSGFFYSSLTHTI